MGIEELDFHVAHSREELERAFRLVYRTYLRAGYLEAHPSEVRFGPHNFLPATRTFVATLRNEVVATVTLVFDSPLGVPMESIYKAELEALRHAGRRLVEVTMLADRRSIGPRTLPIVLRLTKILFDFARDQNPSDDLVIAVHPHHVAFYKRFLYFEALGPLRSYAGVRGNPAVALRLNIQDVERRCSEDPRVGRLYLRIPTPPETFVDPVVLTSDDVMYFYGLMPEVLLSASLCFRRVLQGLYPPLSSVAVASPAAVASSKAV